MRKGDFGNKLAIEQKRIVFERELHVFVDVDSMNIVVFWPVSSMVWKVVIVHSVPLEGFLLPCT